MTVLIIRYMPSDNIVCEPSALSALKQYFIIHTQLITSKEIDHFRDLRVNCSNYHIPFGTLKGCYPRLAHKHHSSYCQSCV